MINRRKFIGIAGVSLMVPMATRGVPAVSGAGKKVLVLGGTGFLGPVLVDELVSHGYSVTLFNRGLTNPTLFPELPLIAGDRQTEDGSGLSRLKKDTQEWDWVVDTWQGSSKAVEDTASILAKRTPQYQFVSTVSVYDKWDRIGITEDEPLNPLPSDAETIHSDNRYAIRKTFSEQVLRRHMPQSSVMFRSHGLRGYPTTKPKHEPYWQVKVARGKQLVAPGDAEYYQVTDMKSLARFMIHAGEQGLNGPFNVAYSPFLFRDFIQGMIEATDSKVELHWLPQEFLLEHDAKLFRTTPAGRYRFDVSRALAAGLANRSHQQLLADQLKGYYDRNPNDDFNFGKPGTATISSARESQLIELWRNRSDDAKVN
ncbi:MAG: NAD-dependent epimerase/dehydratase family protein, partial [Gammaproteobacteria bacterium]|nr:NAD-dependent epimerase/dehydratase family protein [Gammaproteobacteria bacterium]